MFNKYYVKINILLCTLLLSACYFEPVSELIITDDIPTSQILQEGNPLSVLNWNIAKKTCSKTWRYDFRTLIARYQPHLLLLQEVRFDTEMRTLLNLIKIGWFFAPNLRDTRDGIYAGVLTGHVLYPSLAKLLITQGREPLTATPKIALLTYYTWPNEHQILLVTNIHAINFVTLKTFEMQLNQLESILTQHPGPLILAGDFNTWHQQRLNLLYAMKTRLHLKSVFFKNKQAIKHILLSPPLDHVFYRGLCQKQAKVLTHVVSSDHAPLWVEFIPFNQNTCLPHV